MRFRPTINYVTSISLRFTGEPVNKTSCLRPWSYFPLIAASYYDSTLSYPYYKHHKLDILHRLGSVVCYSMSLPIDGFGNSDLANLSQSYNLILLLFPLVARCNDLFSVPNKSSLDMETTSLRPVRYSFICLSDT